MLENAGIPVIETWDLPENPIGHVIGFSNADAVRGMVDHFVAQGLTRIAFIGGDASRDTRGADRRAGFIAAMQAHGLDATTRLIAAGAPPISIREGAAAMGRLLETLPDTQAVICVSDLSAFGALTECQRRGVAVPGKLWIAGFGDYEIAGIAVPALTTINPFPNDIGARTAALILDVLDGRQVTPARIAISPELLIRQSTG
jgi:LacI family gluconate utilization system Gnt-I transcriptional repressor